jgi:hypothetical protein
VAYEKDWQPSVSDHQPQEVDMTIHPLMTPTEAQRLLDEHNTSNRTVRPRVVEEYTRSILQGRWQDHYLNKCSVSTEGVLIDGQHRLMAIVAANKAVPFGIEWNVDPAIADIIDRGSPRRVDDLPALAHIPNKSQVASSHHGRSLKIQRKALAIFAVRAMRKHPDVALDDFLTDLGTGANLSTGDPRLAARQWFIRYGADNKIADRKWESHYSILVKSFNSWMRGEKDLKYFKAWDRLAPNAGANFPDID